LSQLHEGLNNNGCLILVEKILGNDSLFNRMYIYLYYEFKKKQGYSENELFQKREALKNVLMPYRIDENINLLKKCGFETIDFFLNGITSQVSSQLSLINKSF